MIKVLKIMNLINKSIFNKFENLLKLIKLNKYLLNNEKIFDRNNSVLYKSNDKFVLNFYKTKINTNKYLQRNKSLNNRNILKSFWPKCEYKTQNSQHLESHELFHKNINQYKCNFNNCNEIFNRKCTLVIHKHQHSGETPFVCNYNNCGKKFKENGNLSKHICCVHLKNKRFKCDFIDCNKKFNRKEHLIRHKRQHSGEKPFVCNYNNCGKKFTQNVNLNDHKKRHLNIRRYKCFYINCNNSFVRNWELKQHINNIHSIERIQKFKKIQTKID